MVITSPNFYEMRLTIPGSVPLRLEIRELQQNADQWNLYLLGLDAFKKTDETSDLSYYGVCGRAHFQ
jgi:tyrosinase